MINFNGNISNLPHTQQVNPQKLNQNQQAKGFEKTINAVKKQISSIDEMQKDADQSVIDLLTGKNEDITSVVSSVSKADMSFKLLVGVRNKLIEAYKETIRMGV